MTQAQVTLTLNKSQYRGLNKWEAVILGEARILTQQKVVYYVEDPKLALVSFKPEEVLEAEVKINYAQ